MKRLAALAVGFLLAAPPNASAALQRIGAAAAVAGKVDALAPIRGGRFNPWSGD